MKAYTVSELTSAGWTKVTSLTDVANNYYVLVDAGTSDYAMGRLSDGADKPVYMPLADPMGFAGEVWYLGADGDNYTIRSLADDNYFISGTGGWNDQIADQQWGNEGLFTFTADIPTGKFSIKSVKMSLWVGPWNNDNKVSLDNGYEGIAANKAENQAPGFYLYSIPRAVYNANRITASWLTSHGWSQVTDNGALGNADNYYLIIEKVSFGYAMARTSSGRPASKSLSNPFATKNELWLIAAKGSGYSLQNVVDGTYFTSAAGDWNTSMSNSPNADIIATVSDGVYTLSAGGTSSIGHWRDDKYFPYENENIAANKSDANRNSYYIYTISKADYATQRAAYIASLASSATSAAPVELTNFIFNNSDFATLAKLGWTVSGTWGNQQTGGGAYETWNSTNVSITQELANMPGGKYKLSVQMVSGNEGREPYLYASTDVDYKANVTQQASSANYAEICNAIAADPSYGLLTVNPNVTSGTLTVGMKAPTGWVVFDNFKLSYYGPTLASSAVPLPDGGAMTTGQWYYIDIPAAAEYNATATTLTDIVYTTEGETLIEDGGTITDQFAAKDNALSKARYYVKSSSANSLEIAVAEDTYTLNESTKTFSITEGQYLQNISTFVVTYPDAETTSSDELVLIGTPKATLLKGVTPVAEGSLAGNNSEKTLTATFEDVDLDQASTYTIQIAAGVFGYAGKAVNEAVSVNFNTGIIADGVYYFKKKDEYKYLTRGGNYGTETVVDNYGISLQAILQSDGTYYLKNVDHSLAANTDKYLNMYTDQGAYAWTIAEATGGYHLKYTNGNYMTTTYFDYTDDNGNTNRYYYQSQTENEGEAIVWELLSKAEYAASLTAKKNAEIIALATAAGIEGVTTLAELESVLSSDYGTTDKTTSISNPLCSSASGWTAVSYNGGSKYTAVDYHAPTIQIWNTVGGITQTVSELPAGLYKITVSATWRPGNSADATRVGNEANTTAWIYANDNITQLKGWYEGGGTINSTQGLVDNAASYLNTVYVYLNGSEDLKIGVAVPNFCQQNWCPIYNWTLTYYEAKPTTEEKAALVAAISTAEGKTLGFEAGEYAPYNNVDALTKLAEAKAIDPDEASGAAVVAATAALTGATWTANDGEQNAIYWEDYTSGDIAGDNYIHPLGWTNTGYNTRIYSEAAGNMESNTGISAVHNLAMMMKYNTTYGETAGYTMPLKAATVYQISFKYCGWGNTPTTNIVLTDPDDEEIALAPGFRPETNDGNTNAEHWYDYTGYFVTTKAGDYVFAFNKVDGGQQQIGIGDIEIKKLASQTLTFVDNAAMPTYAPGTYPSVSIGRALTKDNWSTLVVPVNMNIPDGWSVKEMNSFTENTLEFKDATSIEAGKPYMVKANSTIANIVASDVEVTALTLNPVTDNGLTMKGVYEAGTVPVSDEDATRYIVSGSKLHKVTSAVSIKPFRAYFELVDGGTGARELIDIDFDGVTAINAIEAATEEAGALKDGKYLIGNKIVLVKNGVKYGANGQKLN